MINNKLPSAYMSYLFESSKGERKKIANLLLKDMYFNKGELSFEIIKKTGDETYTKETFLKAADLIIKEIQMKTSKTN